MKSEFKKLVNSDYLKGAIMAAITVVFTSIYNLIKVPEGEVVDFSVLITAAFWITELKLAIGAFIAYLAKNLLTNSKDQFLKKEPSDIIGGK